MVRALRRDFRVYGQTALSWHRKARACRLILVSGLPADTVRLLGAEPAGDLEEAFRAARGSAREREPAGGSWRTAAGCSWRATRGRPAGGREPGSAGRRRPVRSRA